jgi:cyclin-dependent kinase-like
MLFYRTYGVVWRCKHKETGQVHAIKKFKESDDDEHVRKTAIREVKMLRVRIEVMSR